MVLLIFDLFQQCLLLRSLAGIIIITRLQLGTESRCGLEFGWYVKVAIRSSVNASVRKRCGTEFACDTGV